MHGVYGQAIKNGMLAHRGNRARAGTFGAE
jgi:hypothetical protein